MGVGIFRIGLNRPDLGCWRLTLNKQKCFRNIWSRALNRSHSTTERFLIIKVSEHSVSRGPTI